MITVRHLGKSIKGETILRDVNLHIENGEFVVFVGASGSGKSTLLRCLSLRDSWDQGTVMLDGKDLGELNGFQKFLLKRKWAYLAEQAPLNPNRTAHKTVLGGLWDKFPLWRKLTGRAGVDDHVLAMDYLEQVGLLDKADNKISTLSGGEKQRVGIARELVRGAKVLFLDDPVAGLNPQAAEQVLAGLRSLCAERGVTVISTFPQLEWAEKYGTHLVGIADKTVAVDVKNRRLTMREKQIIFQ
ncbi:phosphonate ABC transporter ATP-binding protein [Paenibacillus thermoaerophilus]|uniref:Phosphonate ABC transporter ATP-binding protein n=1 Tax=Paenibacillus thermoaerophilus TaxID=1215385 RepID=A0ABW2V3S7_9BACL|nr:ATP-binding cassette domain-containing protein [Paenibacillus thermoaerophilus]TMV17171.1 ATP-binding cassette domain-containing protein [Paenibacillus thermoaerophilus]